MPGTADQIIAQLDAERRTVAFDAYDIIVRQLMAMISSSEIDIAPDYQRQFVWGEERESELIESILLGIPVPSLYMAVNAADGVWEVVDGVQRLSTILHFYGDAEHLRRVDRPQPLRLTGLEKLSHLNGITYADLPGVVRTGFQNRSLRVTTLNDRSDVNVRFDLFERLNTGGVGLHAQEIRNIVYRGSFKQTIRQLSTDGTFRSVLKLSRGSRDLDTSAEYEEAVLRFFALLNNYQGFQHLVKAFLNDYMAEHANQPPAPDQLALFNETFGFIAAELPRGITRGREQTPINLYEAIAVGTALAIRARGVNGLQRGVLSGLLLEEPLKRLTGAGSNSRAMVAGRIEYVLNRLI